MKLFFIVGEDSGDALAAPLITSLKAQNPHCECLGVGGPLMAEAGFNEKLPMDDISVIGIFEVIPQIPRLLKIKKALIEEIELQQPDALITVDFPDFNFIIAKELKNRGVFKGKIIHYVSPSVWAWRPKRAQKISKFLDGMMCLFPMEVDYYTKHNLPTKHVGHPLVTSAARNADAEAFRLANGIKPDQKAIGLLFGSRDHEFKAISPILKEAVQYMQDTVPNLHVIAPTLPKYEYKVRKLLEGYDIPVSVTSNASLKWEAFKSCDVALSVSGTVGLELSYAKVPHVTAYKVNPVTAQILKLMLKTKYIHLTNILLNAPIVPECIQRDCNAQNMADIALSILNDPKTRHEQLKAFDKLGVMLGEMDEESPSEKAASFIKEVIGA